MPNDQPHGSMTATRFEPTPAAARSEHPPAPDRPLAVTATSIYGIVIGATQVLGAFAMIFTGLRVAQSIAVALTLIPILIGTLAIAGGILSLRRNNGGRWLLAGSFATGAVLGFLGPYVVFVMFAPPIYAGVNIVALIALFAAGSNHWFSETEGQA